MTIKEYNDYILSKLKEIKNLKLEEDEHLIYCIRGDKIPLAQRDISVEYGGIYITTDFVDYFRDLITDPEYFSGDSNIVLDIEYANEVLSDIKIAKTSIRDWIS